MHPQSLKNCPAPAKLNLFLHVIGRRADGYHLLQSAMQLIDYGDLLHFQIRADGQIRRINDVPGVAEEDDLVVRAAKLLQAHCQPSSGMLGADITLEKHLPMGAGLGGGSSDAATTLIVLNYLWQTGLSRSQLMALSLPLGADIPFFIFGQNAFAEGIGEALTPINTQDSWFVVIEPGVLVPTPAIFTAKDLTRDSKPVKITDFSGHHIRHESIAHGFGRNDLQAVAGNLFPPITEAIDWLSAYGDARMTGSGACVFCAVADQKTADEVLKKVPAKFTAWKAKAMAQHPLAYLLDMQNAV